MNEEQRKFAYSVKLSLLTLSIPLYFFFVQWLYFNLFVDSIPIIVFLFPPVGVYIYCFFVKKKNPPTELDGKILCTIFGLSYLTGLIIFPLTVIFLPNIDFFRKVSINGMRIAWTFLLFFVIFFQLKKSENRWLSGCIFLGLIDIIIELTALFLGLFVMFSSI